jgi:carbamoyl-phosphate synthase small subunit
VNDEPEALIALEDGRVFRGRSFGAPGERCGEAVFNTSMTGYQEILTDPSYACQIVVMTYPLIGNYGVNPEDPESDRIQVEGLVVKEACRVPSNWRSRQSLPDYLAEHGVLGIEGVDTRALTLHIRTAGAMKAAISTEERSEEELVQMARDWEGLVGRDLITKVGCTERRVWPGSEGGRLRVVVYDFGCKHNMLRLLAERGCEVIVVPATTLAEEALALEPDGILLSNGPGDPAGAPQVVAEVRKLLEERPIFGICMGQQLLGLALGGSTFKLKFGHRGANHPVQELASERVDITSQNHGFCVDIESLPEDEVELTHVNLNDQTLEGFRHKRLPIFAVQYHPEASPGPHDASELFDRFVEQMAERAARAG